MTRKAYKLTISSNFHLDDKTLKKWQNIFEYKTDAKSIDDFDFWFLSKDDFIKFIKDAGWFTIHDSKLECQGELVQVGQSFVGKDLLKKGVVND